MGMLQCWRREKIFSADILDLLESEATFAADWKTSRSRTSQLRCDDRAEAGKRKAPCIEQDTESGLGSSSCQEKMRRAPCSTQTSEHQSDAPSAAGEQETVKNCAWLPLHIKFVPGEDLPEPAPTVVHKFSGSQICESSIPGAHMLKEVDGASHKPSWPAPKVPPPLSLPKGARRIGCT